MIFIGMIWGAVYLVKVIINLWFNTGRSALQKSVGLIGNVLIIVIAIWLDKDIFLATWVILFIVVNPILLACTAPEYTPPKASKEDRGDKTGTIEWR